MEDGEEEDYMEDGEEEEWVLYRPTSGVHLAQGFGTTFGYLALLDLLVARRAVDQTSRFFILHTLANIAITIAATRMSRTVTPAALRRRALMGSAS